LCAEVREDLRRAAHFRSGSMLHVGLQGESGTRSPRPGSYGLTRKMRIAYLTSRLPYPPIGGDRVRAYHFLRYLLRSHEVTLYAIESGLAGTADDVSGDLEGLKQKSYRMSPVRYGWNALKAAFSGLPFQVKLYENSRLVRALAEDAASGTIDLVFVHLVRMAEYARPLRSIPRILDMVDSICMHYHRMPARRGSLRWLAARLDRGRVCKYENQIPTWFDAVLVTSPLDLAWLRERSQAGNLLLVPNGVDTTKYPFFTGGADSNRIVFFGKLDYLPNSDAAVYFATEIFPLVKRRVPQAEFVVVGWNPPREVRKLSRIPGIAVRANVSDVGSEVGNAAISVAPLRFGAGIQNKILESLALGVPVVASPSAAAPITDEREGLVLVGRTPVEFAELVVKLLEDSGYRTQLGRAGRALVESRFQWDKALAPLDGILERARQSRAR